MNVTQLPLYYQTLRHLRARQFFFRLLRKVQGQHRRLPSIHNVSLRSAVSFSFSSKKSVTGGEGSFKFLNETKSFPDGRIDWCYPEMSKLWRYNLHYFDYLHDARQSFESRSRYIADWIANNPVGTPDAWEPFPVSLRVVNWIKFFLFPENVIPKRTEWLESLYKQVLWLERNIEYHLLANHYFKNGKALSFAGIFFESSDAARWLNKGLQILTQEIQEQILPDGGHFERSPMYHSMILEDCLDLLNICSTRSHGDLKTFSELLFHASKKMIHFLEGLTHPDGQIALFNDAAFGIELHPKDLVAYYERVTGQSASSPEGEIWDFPETGYFVLAPKDGDRMLMDCGPIGPDYQPGHSHCDMLSFELSLKGRRVIVDSGCHQYDDAPIRQYNRGNAGHNTVTIDGENQSEVWGAHRFARRARPIYTKLEQRTDGCLFFEGAHDGYRRLPGSPVHHRSVKWTGNECRIEDRIEGSGRHAVESRLHIHPGLDIGVSEDSIEVRDKEMIYLNIALAGDGRMDKVEGWYCPEFGKRLPCIVLKQHFENVSLPFKCGWVLHIH